MSQAADVRQRRLTTAAERGLITQTAIRRIGRLCTAFKRLLIAQAFFVVGHGWWLMGVTAPGIQNGNRHSADGSVVRNTKRYTLKHRVATATTQITIRDNRRHGKLKISDYCLLATSDVYIPCMSPRNHADCDAVLSGHSRSLLAQFGLTPKSRRGLGAGEITSSSI